jgi:hypothetical protein
VGNDIGGQGSLQALRQDLYILRTANHEIQGRRNFDGGDMPNALTDISGVARQTVDKYIRRSHAADLIHIAGFGPSPFGGKKTVKLWAYGRGEDVKRVYVKPVAKPRKPKGTPKSLQMIRALSARKMRALEEANRMPVCDPITMALFGIKRPCLPALLTAPGRIIKQSMEVTEDELEAA